MRYIFTGLALLTVAIVPLVPAARVSAQGSSISVGDFTTVGTIFALTATPPLRRGVTSQVLIIKDFIDLVPFSLVSTTGGGTISSISNGRTLGGKGFIKMNVAVPAGQSPGSIITLKVGLSDQFTFKAVHTGLISSVTANPLPASVLPGTPFVVTFQGTDLGAPVADLSNASCHTASLGPRTSTSAQFTLTRSANCDQTVFMFTIAPSAGDDPPNYRTAAGLPTVFVISYLGCAPEPSIGAPVITQPANGQVILFGQGAASPGNILFRWNALTVGQRPAPNRQWIVTRESTGRRPISQLISAGITVTAPQGTPPSVTLSFAIPGRHSVTIKAKNCGENAPSSTVSFSTQYQ